MRIVTMENMPAAVRTDVSDLLGRLDTGDVIKARVLDVKSGEVVLRLSDGSLLKARSEGFEAKQGQMLTLSVTSREEGTLYLETVKDPSRQNRFDSNTIINMLKSVQIEPDPQNMAIASEFAKAGISITAELMDQAADLMKGFKGLDAEKAVFITGHLLGKSDLTGNFESRNVPQTELVAPGILALSKGLQMKPVRLELLSKLLDGELKIGNQIKELQTLLGMIGENTGKDLDTYSVSQKGITAMETGISGQAASGVPRIAANIQNSLGAVDNGNSHPGDMSAEGIRNVQSGGTSAEGVENTPSISGRMNSAENAEKDNNVSTTLKLEQTKIAEQSVSGSDQAALSPAQSDTSKHTASQTSAAEQTTAAGKLIPHASAYETDPFVTRDTDNKINQIINVKVQSGPQLEDAIGKIFIDIRSDQVVEELDLGSLHKELDNKLDMLEDSIKTSGLAGLSGSESLTSAAAKLNDSVNLLNQLSHSNMLYYQLPVNLSGFRTTAELYVMKRQADKKRIDPHDTVMFISLDTEHLGRIETLLDVKGVSVSIGIRTEKAQINDFVKENIRYLYAGLAESGYKLANISYTLIDKPSSPMKQEKLLSKMIDPDHIKLDMRI
ncbi:MAG: flagellar hook-length control protein FliK [Clostridiaceae bacterium]